MELARKNYAENSPVVLELKERSEALSKQIKQLEAGEKSIKPRYLILLALFLIWLLNMLN